MSETLEPLIRPALYVVATPLGNLGDLSSRALQVLRRVDLIAAEDTRHSSRLTHHFGITVKMVSYHDYNAPGREQALLRTLQAGKAVALISDAGTPLISDPGYRLVRSVRDAGIRVIPVPGPSALTAALSVAGMATDRFAFEGFPAAKTTARRQQFQGLASYTGTLVFYESPHRIVESIKDMVEVFGGQRRAVICRELTKTWETIQEASLAGLVEWLNADDNHRRGEFVVLVQGAEKVVDEGLDEQKLHVLRVLMRELPLKRAAAVAAELTGGKKNAFYRRGLELNEADSDA